ncbi:efflux transporter periplasmic adaptor subunit [Aliidiomarina minuta]|uniref:Efflux transporter periplasmic adaptor subunit n=1 Tax=Aliidiomarina minuta TaxID=880057 RepID=A0A432W877_9GAMM|nr:efflux RND transporter periplasmic adaptor subunit [Aliidiomarina minuta]RUO26239.1 efflux transporter periplasmic adaptor subunit [Aliidiomarina minuta]
MKLATKPLIFSVIGVALLILIVWALRPGPIQVSTAVAEQGHFAEYVEEEARTRLRNTYNISAPIQGYLQRVELEPGDSVEAGETLFALETTPTPSLDARSREQARETLAAARSRRNAAQAVWENQVAEHEFAQREFARIENLHGQALVSQTELERAANTLARAHANERAAKASLESASYEVDNARAVLEITEGTRTESQLPVVSPIEGVVLQLHRCCEGVVAPGQEIMQLGNLDELEVRVDVLSADAVRITPGMKVEFERWGGEGALYGQVRRVEPAGYTRYSALGIEEQRVPVYVEFTSERDKWQQLGYGYRLESIITLWESDDVIHIPVNALFREDDTWHVFVVENGRARLQAVETGRRSGIRQQITSGLQGGQRVITHPPSDLSHNQRVQW